ASRKARGSVRDEAHCYEARDQRLLTSAATFLESGETASLCGALVLFWDHDPMVESARGRRLWIFSVSDPNLAGLASVYGLRVIRYTHARSRRFLPQRRDGGSLQGWVQCGRVPRECQRQSWL